MAAKPRGKLVSDNASLRGDAVLDRLMEARGIETERALAASLGYSVPGLLRIRRSSVTAKSAAGLIERSTKAALSNAAASILPIVEFFPIHSPKSLLDAAKPDQIQLREALSSTCGLYSFYNSELEIIYVGKTVQNTIWAEMCSVFTQRNMPHYRRYRVHHPHGKYSPSDPVRKIQSTETYLNEAARYFSAYNVPAELVTALETLIIRMVPNDLLNVRMEGNQRLKTYQPDG